MASCAIKDSSWFKKMKVFYCHNRVYSGATNEVKQQAKMFLHSLPALLLLLLPVSAAAAAAQHSNNNNNQRGELFSSSSSWLNHEQQSFGGSGQLGNSNGILHPFPQGKNNQ